MQKDHASLAQKVFHLHKKWPFLTTFCVKPRLTPAAKLRVVAALNQILGLQIDLSEFYRLAAQDRRLRLLAERFRGLKPHRSPSLFETLVNAIVCQQITLTFGIQILNSLAENCGAAINGSDLHAFPRPSDLAGAAPERLKLSRQKVRAISELSGAVVEGRLDLEGLSAIDDEAATTRLRLRAPHVVQGFERLKSLRQGGPFARLSLIVAQSLLRV